MTRLLLAFTAATALASTPVAASVGPFFLPDLTFPAPHPQPDMSSQGCHAPAVCK